MCNTERRYDEHHKLYKRCNKCNVRCSVKYYYANKDKELEKRIRYYQTNREKNNDLERNRRNIHKNETDEINNKVQALTQAMETLISTITVA